MKVFITIVTVLLLSGCVGVQPPMNEYKLNSHMPTSKSKTQSIFEDKSLKVAEAFSPNTLMSLDMNYVQGVNKQFAFSQAKWATTPNQAITAKLLELLRDANLFKNIQVSKSRSKSDLILETNIEDFMQYFSEDFKESYSSVVLTLTLIDFNKNSVIVTKTFRSKVNAKSLDVEGGVVALDAALYEVLSQINEWFTEVNR